MTRRSGPIWAVLAVAGVWGCAHGRGVNQPGGAAPPSGDYRIGAGDVVEIDVWHDADLSRTLPVRPDGKVTLPLIGDVPAEGRTTAQLQADIQQRLAGLVHEPKVVVIVRDFNAAQFYAVGEVEKPGAYPIRHPVSLLQALAMAGGAGAFSSKSEVVVVRGADRYSVDYDDLVSGKAGMDVEPGDTIVVP